MPTWFTCQRACVPTWFTWQRTCVPKACQRCLFTCQRANKRVNVLYGVAMFQVGMPTCQFFNLAYQCAKGVPFFEHSSYAMIREYKNIKNTQNIKNSTLYLISKLYISYVYALHIKIVLYFISDLHAIFPKSVWNLLLLLCFSFLLFWSFVTSNKSFLEFSTAKTSKQNKEYLWILWSSWIVICLSWRSDYKKPYCD